MRIAIVLAVLATLSAAKSKNTTLCKKMPSTVIFTQVCHNAQGLFIKDRIGGWHRYEGVPGYMYLEMVSGNTEQYFDTKIKGNFRAFHQVSSPFQ